ncbi:MAG: biotin/lipoyl-containing protein [Saprospiraceae bacterium]|nr:biotin/lipoyl-containing protein [Saprospiraceae bacterium]
MARDIQFCLVYRDMFQSSGKFMPKVDQLVKVAPEIVNMGCFTRVETNGGGFEQINLLMGENPNRSVREWTQAFNDAGIQTQMLERGLNGIRMSPVPEDVRKLMFRLKKKQGTDIARSFDGLNNPQNLRRSFEYAKDGGMIAQGALSLTHSPIHTVEYYIELADQYIALGAEEICIKDMAGIGRPVSIGKIIRGIKSAHPDVLVQYHGHSTPGFSVASSLEAARAGADIIDVGMEPLSWGTGHADLLTIHAMLKDAGFNVPDINMKAYMKVRSLTQSFVDDFLGYFINPQNRKMNSLLIGPGLPGGMMGSLMADLEKNLESLNKWLAKRDREPLTQDELLLKLFEEVEYVWPRLGYPPLVTPFSQYVKNTALMNVIQIIKERGRWTMIDENTWGMILGKSGQLPGEIGVDIKELAKEQGREFYTKDPQLLYPDELSLFAQKMDEKGWDYGKDDEELFEYAMHPTQYENYKSGKAKEDFEAEVDKRRREGSTTSQSQVPGKVEKAKEQPQELLVELNGKSYNVQISYPDQASTNGVNGKNPHSGSSTVSQNVNKVVAPLEGTFYLTKDSNETPVKVGDRVKPGDTIGYIESMKVYNAIVAEDGGTILEINTNNGEDIEEDEVILTLQ